MIRVLHWGEGYAQMIAILDGGGVSQDPQKWLRNMCTTPYYMIPFKRAGLWKDS